jgi:hypothetical protein
MAALPVRIKALPRKRFKEKRLALVHEHINSLQSFWNRVPWRDKSEFELFKSNRKTWVGRKLGTAFHEKKMPPTAKHWEGEG